MPLFRPFLWCSVLATGAQAGLLAHWKLDSSPADEVGDFRASWSVTPAYITETAAPSSPAAASLEGGWLSAGTSLNLENSQAFSASAWIKGTSQDSSIIGDMTQSEGPKGWDFVVGTTENGGNADSLAVILANDYPAIAIQVNAAINVLDNQWHHIAFTYDGSAMASGVKIYIDGALVPTTAGLDTLGGGIANNEEAELNIGTRMNGAGRTLPEGGSGPDQTFTGAIDEVALFDHAVTAAEMTAIYQTGVGSVFPPQVLATVPQPGESVDVLTTADVRFSLPVSGVDAADLRINGGAAATVQAIDTKNYRFTFPTPPQGDVHFTWTAGHGITGLNGVAVLPLGWSCKFVPVLPAGQVVITEFLAKNAGGREDEDHDTPDWIEIHNPGTANVDLAGWALSDDADAPRAWVFPTRNLAPGGRLLIFASGKNRTNPAGTLHTNFKLSDDGGYLSLADPSGTVIQEYNEYPRQEGNVSFGLTPSGRPSDGRRAWRYQPPSPLTVNSSSPYSGTAILSMEHSPAIPAVGDTVTVTIRTSPDSSPVFPPTLYFKRMHGSEAQTNFFDDGLHGDGAAGDRVWTATIPAQSAAGEMIRWRVSLTSNSVTSRWPISTNPGLSLPLYEGTVVSGNTAGQALPVYQIFFSGYNIPGSINQAQIDTDNGGRAAFFGNGKLYDNVLIRIKGTTSRYLYKRSHRVDFNPGRDFQWSPDFPAQRELNLNSEYNDPSYLRQNQQLRMHRESGGAGAQHFPVRLLMNGVNWQLAFHTYSADSELVETMGLDPKGALYKQVGTLSTGAGGEKKSRKWEGNEDYTAFKAGIASGTSQSQINARYTYIHDNTNLPAVINYLAVTRIAQEADDVWANMVIYRDSEGTKEWQPIPFDLNLSFGQLFYGGVSDNMTVHADHDYNKSHPLYGTSTTQPYYGGNGWNRLYEAVIMHPVTRAMLLRRIRTLSDHYLGQSAATSNLNEKFDSEGALILNDANIDRALWGLPPNSGAYGLGSGISPTQGLATLKSQFLDVRRTHFFNTHSITNTGFPIGVYSDQNAGIPNAQVALPVLQFGTVEAHPAGSQDQEYVQISNPGTDAVDISGWTLRGAGGLFKLKGGTVIPAGGSVYVSPDVTAFRNRTTSPKKGEGRQVVGPYSGHLSPYGETLKLENEAGTVIAQVTVAPDPNAPPVSLAVTEIMSSSAHTTNTVNGDWWELTNTGSSALDLAGFSWDDNHFVPNAHVFPPFTLAAGETIVILNEDDQDEVEAFRAAWNVPASVRFLTRDEFGLPDFAGLGNGDSVAVYLPDGTQVARADYPGHSAGKSRAWFSNGVAVPGGYSVVRKFGATQSNQTPSDVASPGYVAADPTTLTDPYDIWAAENDLWPNPADPSAALGADADGDGRSNLSEYAFGGNPRLSDTPPAQAITALPEGVYQLTFTRRAGDPSLDFAVETSGDLADWTRTALVPVNETPHPTLAGYVETTCVIPAGAATQFIRAVAE